MSEPLNNEYEISLADVKLTPPVFAAGAYAFEVVKQEVTDNKAGTGKNFVVTFASLASATSKDKVQAGESDANDIPAGRQLTKYYPLQQSDNPKAPDFRADLTRLMMALHNCSQADCPPFRTSNDLTGKKLVLQLRVAPANEATGYGESNEVSKYMPLT
mgnify:CR=1 FL=1